MTQDPTTATYTGPRAHNTPTHNSAPYNAQRHTLNMELQARNGALQATLTTWVGKLDAETTRLEISKQGMDADTKLKIDLKLLDIKDLQKELNILTTTLQQPDTYLLDLQYRDGNVCAAVANGNITDAKNIAIIIPGVGTTIKSSLQYWMNNATQLQNTINEQNTNDTQNPNHNTATIAYLGYPAPKVRELLESGRSLINDAVARQAAEPLVDFLEKLPKNPEATTTLIGHSYGSLVTGMALTLANREQQHIADQVIFMGSPGLGVDNINDLGLKDRIYTMEAAIDPIAGLGWFGTDPEKLPEIQKLDTRQRDGMKATWGHSGYFEKDSTSLWNIAAVVDGKQQDILYKDESKTPPTAQIGRVVQAATRRISGKYLGYSR